MLAGVELLAFAQWNGFLDGEFAAPRPAQANEMSPATVIRADIVCEAARIRSGGTRELELHLALFHPKQFQRLDCDDFGAGSDLDTLSRVGVQRFALHLFG